MIDKILKGFPGPWHVAWQDGGEWCKIKDHTLEILIQDMDTSLSKYKPLALLISKLPEVYTFLKSLPYSEVKEFLYNLEVDLNVELSD